MVIPTPTNTINNGINQIKKKLIIDCDPGVDDMEALLMALASKDTEIIAVTTVAGNASAKMSYTNTRNIMSFCAADDIPVFKGCKINLSAKYADSDGYFGEDSLGNINLQKCKTYKKEKYSSVQAILHYVNKYPCEVHLVAIGPLTNLALAFILDKHFPKKLASLTIMGGDRSEKTIKNVSPYSEFNSFSDPCAWRIVMQHFSLSNGKKINLIDFTFCLENLLSKSFITKFYGESDADVEFCLRGILIRKTLAFMSSKLTDEGVLTCDSFALFASLYPQYILSGDTCVLKHIDVQGEKVGHTDFEKAEDGNIFMINKIDMEKFKEVLYASIRPV